MVNNYVNQALKNLGLDQEQANEQQMFLQSEFGKKAQDFNTKMFNEWKMATDPRFQETAKVTKEMEEMKKEQSEIKEILSQILKETKKGAK